MGERLAKLADPDRRQGLKDQPPTVATAPLETVTVLSPRSPSTERFREMSVRQVADATGKHPVDAMLDIAVADELRTALLRRPAPGHVGPAREIVQYPHMLFGVSDGGAHTKFLTAGRYPTETLAQQVRDNHWITYEEAHRRLSGLPAQLAGFHDRGLLRLDGPADVVVYDPDHLASGRTRWSRTCPAVSGDASSGPRGTTPCSSTGCARSPTTPRPNGTRAGCCATAGAEPSRRAAGRHAARSTADDGSRPASVEHSCRWARNDRDLTVPSGTPSSSAVCGSDHPSR